MSAGAPEAAGRGSTPPTIDGRYRLLRRLGAGGQGEVWLADDVSRGDRCALKVVPGVDAGAARALLAEMGHLARVQHPALVPVRDLGRVVAAGALPAGAVYLTADFVDGTPGLEAIATADDAERARLIWTIAADVASALAVVHGAGLVHRDVAPGNVLVVGRGAEARAVLLDLGLCAARGRGVAAGTPPYMAPEALAGDAGPRGDLWSLGATLHHLATGAALFAREGVAATARAVLVADIPAATGVPSALAALIARLLVRDPARRTASALALLDELDAIAGALPVPVRPRSRPAVRAPALAPPLVGAGAALATIEAALDATLAGEPRAVRVWGPPGAGAAAVVAEAVRRHQRTTIEHGGAPRRVVRGDLDAVAAALGVDAAEGDERAAGRFAGAVARAIGDAIAVVEVVDDPRGEPLLRAVQAGVLIAIVTREAAPAARDGIVDVAVGAVSVEDVAALAAELLDRRVPAPWAAALHAASHGLPALAADIVGLAAREADPFAIDPGALAADAASVAAAWVAAVARGPVAERAVLEAVAVWGGRAIDEAAVATARALVGDDAAAALGALVASGRLARDGARVAMSAPLARALVAAIAEDRRRSLHRAAAEWPGADDDARALHRAAAGATDAEAPSLVDAGMRLLARGRAGDALALAAAALTAVGARTDDEAAALDDRGLAARAHLLAARAALGLGRYPRAADEAMAAARAPAAARRAQLLLARIRQRAGDLGAAEALLAPLVAADRDAGRDDDEAAGAYARLLVARARYPEAAAVAGEVDALIARGAGALRIEAAGLAAVYQGQLDAGDRAFAGLEAGAGDDAALAGRALALRGMVAQQRGDLVASSGLYARAAAASRAAGDVHAAAVADLNAGNALSERGRFAEALPVLTAASADLAEVGAVAERAAATFNRGNALLALGSLDAARAAAAEAAALAIGHGLPHVEVFARLLAADVARRAGDRAAAMAACAEAERLARRTAAPYPLLCALLARAELIADGEPAAALALVAEAEGHAGSDDDRDRVTLARGRGRLAAPPGGAVTATALAGEIDGLLALAARARQRDRIERAYRATALAARLARATPARARTLAAEAGALFAAMAGASPAWSMRLGDDVDGPAVAALLEGASPGAAVALAPPNEATGARGADAAAALEIQRLRRLLALSRRLNGEGALDRLLDDVIDAAIELTDAERGFLLLRRGTELDEAAADGDLEVVVARGFTAGDLVGAPSISRSIAERAAASGEPVITLDAGLDERFGAAASVAALRLRSVMAVPLRQKGRVTGCLYVDHRLRGGAFDERAAAPLLDLADIAAIAVGNARLAADLRRRKDEIDGLNQRLAADIADRDAELVAVRARLGAGAALGEHYPTLVGRSPAMVALIERLDRAARVALPVVIVGESGTGKELVARALHDHSPRRDRAFVAVNCSAMPEALLESELFGHVRGAFTGADRDRRGLFEVADGGTLFLDEIAETGRAMQAKLLRVLQDGTFRAVGDDRVRRADVRVVAASQQPLAELVSAGRFRDDLRFRLDVIGLEVPPLRARQGDVPLLVEHVLARLAAGRTPPRLTRAALRALGSHAWPGNVRELENALARALALGGEVIDVDDLPEAVTRSERPAGAPVVGDDLMLKPAVAALERAYLDAALSRAGGNQTVAARLLGLSRFGLQKKLRRLSGEADDD